DLMAGLLSPGLGNNQTDTRGFNVVPGNTEGSFINRTASGDINDAAAQFKRTIYSFYWQDDWRANDSLNIVGGLRLDWFRGDRPERNENFAARYGISNDTGFNDINAVVLPRLGITYNVPEFSVTRRSKVQGGVGIFSGGDPLVWFGNVFQNNGQAFAQASSQAAGCPAGQIDVVVGGEFTGIPECVLDAASTTAGLGQGFTQSIDPSIKLPTVWRANLGFQTDLEFGASPFARGWHVNLDYIYSRYKNPFTIVDLTQVPDFRRGLNGFTIDGRPIYQTIDPLLCGARLIAITPTPIYTGVTSACFTSAREDELMLTNADGYRTHVASAILQKNFDAGIFTPGGSSYFTLGYAYTNAQDRRNMFNSTAGSNFDQTAAFDRQNPDASRGFYESRHNATFSGNFRENFFSDLATSLGFTFVARSGRPYSLTFSGSGVFNDSASGSNNALLYIPTGPSDPNISPLSNMTAVQQLHDFAAGLDCARDFIGRTIERNSCSNDWYYDLDLRVSQEIPGPGRLLGSPRGIKDKITLYAMFDNFLNFLDKDWNVQRRRQFAGLQEIASLNTTSPNVGVDAQGRYIISSFLGEEKFRNDNFINVSSSVWRIKIGASYEF
ncbi:MAG TPA: TonB-dependent receptor, partial [Vicinamibacterales bacterium]|nr:TonB-dependent receptor [Vicinamibacterales bacterium]